MEVVMVGVVGSGGGEGEEVVVVEMDEVEDERGRMKTVNLSNLMAAAYKGE